MIKGEEIIFCKILHYDNSWTESFQEKKRTQVRYKKSGTYKLNHQINCDKTKIKEATFTTGADFPEFEGLWMNFYSSTSVLEGRLQRGSTVYTYKRFRDLEYQGEANQEQEGQNEE